MWLQSVRTDRRHQCSTMALMMSWRPPVNEVPVRVTAISGFINRSADVAIWLNETLVYTSGVVFALEIRKRVATGLLNVTGFDRPSTDEHGGPLFVGFHWSDNTTSTNLPEAHNNAGGLNQLRAGGTPASVRATYALDHHPPGGPFTIVTAWPHLDLPEHTVTFDAADIATAALSVETLWEPVSLPTTSTQRRPPTRVRVVPPAGGWFADHYDPTPLPPAGSHDGPSRLVHRVVSGPAQPDPSDWVDGAPTTGRDETCVFCGSANVTWVHPFDRSKTHYRAHGKPRTLASYWMLCQLCEQIYQTGDDDAAIEAMKNHWVWHDIDESLRKPLQTFRRADRGARKLVL